MELLFVIAPIYWLPGVSDGLILIAKLTLLGLAAYMALIPPNHLISLTFKGVWFLIAFMFALGVDILLYFVHGVLDLKFLLIFIFLGLGFVYLGKIGEEAFFSKAKKIAILFCFFPSLLVIDSLFFGGAINNPKVGLPAYLTGFHGGRTGWSFVLGVFLAVMLSSALKKSDILSWAVIAIYAYAIFISGSRGGVLVVLALFGMYSIVKYGLVKGAALYSAGLISSGVCLALAMLSVTEIESRILQSIFAPEELHTASLTGGRLEGFEVALQIFMLHPWWGAGEVNLESYGFAYQSIHNVWLKTLAERGMMGVVGLLVVSLSISYKLFVGGRLSGPMLLIFSAGFLPTLYEPTAIFGNFWSASMFWFLIGGGFAASQSKVERFGSYSPRVASV